MSASQVLTSVPIPESWGHFPKSKARLLQLLDDTKPRGTMLIRYIELIPSQTITEELSLKLRWCTAVQLLQYSC
jgi:hypothetical protein